MTTLDNDLVAKSSTFFTCKNCDFVTCKKYNYTKHINSIKHKNTVLTTLDNDLVAKRSKNYICDFCEKKYNDRAGLWRHKKKCTIQNNNNTNHSNTNHSNTNHTNTNHTNTNHSYVSTDKDELIHYLMKESQELKELILEIAKKDTYNQCTTNNNSNNKSFNLQFFLNETCKDAMNIMEFVDSIKLQLSDLERVGELGYVEGISNIIVKNLNNLDVTQRPVHCTDKKREVLYVKDENKWEKEDDSKAKIHKVIKKVADKNIRMIPRFKEEHPDCYTSTSKFSDQYNKIIIEAMGGPGDNDKEKEERIVKNITKKVTLDKDFL